MEVREDSKIIVSYVGDMTKLQVKKGDIFVVSAKRVLSIEETVILKEKLSAELKAPVIVLCEDMKLGIIEKEETK